MAQDVTVLFGDLRGGRNSADPPLELADDQCVEALNVDWWKGSFGSKRGGTVDSGASSPPGEILGTILRHVPGVDETAAELWGWGDSLGTYRLAGGTAWANPTVVDALQANEEDVSGVSFAGMFFIAQNTAQNRLHVWDPSITKVRRVGLATPGPPTGATMGGAGLTFSRDYRIRTFDNTTPGKRRSEASTSITVSITDDQGVTVTRPTLPTSEDETHWEVEYRTTGTTPWYRAAQVATGTTTYNDTAATIDTTNLSNSAGIHYPPPSAKYLVKDSGRILMAGAWETSGGYTTPNSRRIWWTSPFGSLDVGDAERIPNPLGIGAGSGFDVEFDITGMAGPIQGTTFVFGYRRIVALTPTGSSGAAAYSKQTLRADIGCVRNQSCVLGQDENGNPALYFLSHLGPYRIGSAGIQYLGNDIEDVWATVNLDATKVSCSAVYYADKHQVWWCFAVNGGNDPSVRYILDVRLIRYNEKKKALGGGWAKHTGVPTQARSMCVFSTTIGASMSRRLQPYATVTGGNGRIWKCDSSTADVGSAFQAYLDTKPVAPFGLRFNMSVSDPQLVADVSTGVTITVSPLSDFGLATAQSGTALLTAAGSETQVQKRIEGLQASQAGVMAFRVGDAAAVSNGWTLHALDMIAHQQDPRS